VVGWYSGSVSPRSFHRSPQLPGWVGRPPESIDLPSTDKAIDRREGEREAAYVVALESLETQLLLEARGRGELAVEWLEVGREGA
jgi:hypothetical protein